MKKLFSAFVVCVLLLGLNFQVVAEENFYVVKSGDNLWTIAQKHGITVDNLKAWNNLSSELLQIGDRLLVQPPTSNQPSAASTPTDNQAGITNTYTVKANDNLWAIAMAYNATVEDLMAVNHLSSDALQVGDVLTIPAAGSKAVSPSRSGVRAINSDVAAAVLQTAAEYLGTPYKYNGSGPGGFDCSGFVKFVFSQHGYDLPRTAATQAGSGLQVDKGDLMPGDIVYFRCSGSSIDHSGIYAGNGQFIHSSSPRSGGVIYSSINEGFYGRTYAGARRVL